MTISHHHASDTATFSPAPGVTIDLVRGTRRRLNLMTRLVFWVQRIQSDHPDWQAALYDPELSHEVDGWVPKEQV